MQTAQPSAWSPLRQPLFRALWTANLVSNVGTLMQGIGAAWLMTSLDPSPVMVSLVQVATTFPMFLLALPAGALADIIDRRLLLLVAQTWMLAIAAFLGVLTVWHITGAWTLILLTFALGVGAALNGPAWQATVLDVVPRSDLSAAVSLNSAGFNAARAIGPMLGGFIIAAAGPGAVFLLNAISFVGVIAVLFRWRRVVSAGTLPAERVFEAMRTGVRYVRHAPYLRSVYVRTIVFTVFASAMWPMLPLIARFELNGSSTTYGILLGFFGVGSVAGAAMLPQIRRRLSVNALVAADTLVFAAFALVLAFSRNFAALCLTMCAAGAAWLTLLSNFNSSTQGAVPLWVRGRAMSVYLLIFFGSLAGGNALWGMVAKYTSIRVALVASAAGMIIGLLATIRYRLPDVETLDTTPATDPETPTAVGDFDPEHGPVIVMVEYRIDPAKTRDFRQSMREVRLVRKRDGAIRWGLTRDTTDPTRFVEFYVTESWIEHLRQHHRLTVSDRAVFDRARAYHVDAGPPKVSHFVFAYESNGNGVKGETEKRGEA
ncbi:MFS transporter [Candidatus Poribacteria bacterium]|nr:MFS transporter [Candidatus Poribacteria bacterium]